MEKCDYGCGNEAKYGFKNGKKCCSPNYRSCPHQAAKIGKTRLGKKHTKETKKKIGNKHKGKTPWHKGKTGVYSEETLKRMSDVKKGSVAWNKGLTAETDERIASMVEKNKDGRTANRGEKNGMYGQTHTEEVKQQLREKNIANGKWKGEDNPWYGKDRSGENSPRFLSEKERTEWEEYSSKVRSLTEITYRKNENIINPNGYNRGITDYHLDHIVPIWYGFKNNVDPELLSLLENLRIISWDKNIKRNKVKLNDEELKFLQKLKEQYNKGEL